MITVLSPAKSLDFVTPCPPAVLDLATVPQYVAHAAELNQLLRAYDVPRLAQLMSISDKLAHLNVGRNQVWQSSFGAHNSKPALLTFDGDVYDGLQANSLTTAQLTFAQQHVRILSGLYGVLRPLDWLQAYRLEMGTKLPNAQGKDLYAFWGQTLALDLNQVLAQQPAESQVLINLASEEYFKAVALPALQYPVIAPVFKDADKKGNGYKIISFFAKKARGSMARFVLENALTQAEDLKAFQTDGYYFVAEQVLNNGVRQWVFHRDGKDDKGQ